MNWFLEKQNNYISKRDGTAIKFEANPSPATGQKIQHRTKIFWKRPPIKQSLIRPTGVNQDSKLRIMNEQMIHKKSVITI